jgi:hypothetical protein
MRAMSAVKRSWRQVAGIGCAVAVLQDGGVDGYGVAVAVLALVGVGSKREVGV